MRLQEFRLLAKERQIEVIKDTGAYLFMRQEAEADIILYQLEGFYVEVFFDGQQLQGPRIKCFEAGESLEIYLQQINIDEVQSLLRV
jgi:hypothetical protein